MSHKEKILIIVLGNGEFLKKALITNILGKDLFKLYKKSDLKETEIFENDTYEIACTPDLDTACEDIKDIFFLNRHPDMCLLVVEDGFSVEVVWQQIEQLQEITRKPTEEFRVVLPLSSEPPDSYPFRCNNLEQVDSELRGLAVERNLIPTNKRHADHRQSAESSHTMREGRSWRWTHVFTKKNSKRKSSASKVNLVLLGMAGAGKSASGNTILGKKQFTSKASSNPVTTECQEAEREIDGTRVCVIDTPDMFDDEIESSVKNKHVKRCKELCQSGPCVYLLVMHVSRFTDGERDILKKLEKAFGSKVQERTVILFTRGDDLQRDNVTFEDFLSSCQPDLREIVEKCGNRCVVFENGASDSRQVKELMETVEGLSV